MFTALHTDGEARSGVLRLASGREIATPAMLVYTRRGGVLNLTPDLQETLQPDVQALHLNALQLYVLLRRRLSIPITALAASPCPPRHPPLHPSSLDHTKGLAGFPGSARDFLGIDPSLAVVVTPRDPCIYEFQGSLRQSTDEWATVATVGGAKTMSPEEYMAIALGLDPDLVITLSDEVSCDSKRSRATASARRAAPWLARSLAAAAAAKSPPPAIFAAVQGAQYVEERQRCVDALAPHLPALAGVCVGGLGTGETPSQRQELIATVLSSVPAEKARMASSAAGTPEEVLAAVAQGMDLFDVAYLTDATAGGYALTFPVDPQAQQAAGPAEDDPSGADDTKINLWAASYRTDRGPLVPGCGCIACTAHTRAYLHHLWKANEPVVHGLLTLHNLKYMMDMMASIRGQILRDEI